MSEGAPKVERSPVTTLTEAEVGGIVDGVLLNMPTLAKALLGKEIPKYSFTRFRGNMEGSLGISLLSAIFVGVPLSTFIGPSGMLVSILPPVVTVTNDLIARGIKATGRKKSII
ncbi:MAG: hypothetical protein Q7R74_02050 [bacterium]|nr:hypothetical protein [bacterium]